MQDQTLPKEDVPVSDILKELAEKIDSIGISRFNINRSNVLDGAIRGLKRLTFSPCNTLNVRFSDDKGATEEAIDLGGPRREFLRLLMQTLSESEMFEGREGHRNLALDFRGTAIALSLVHGGPPPCFLSKTLFTGISEGADQCQPELEDVTDSDLRDKLTKVSEATTLHDLQLSVEPISDYLATAGCLRLLTSLTDKYPLLEDILMFHVVHRVRAPLERFKDGLKTLGVLPKIQQHPEAFRPLLCYNPPTLTADSLDCLFTINWSEDGSNSRIGENKTVAFWRDFLQDVEGD
ncbi:G2/M phase-specific E3 ubiquitin-protein ligase-like [Eleginops maclovinus]|uniref:G2/M phase-specific E3 ubiquitin-protein ligase-like n=1 Tax=Eleginops maclovinus TaxID=56733 RepID=UPI003080B282